MSTFNVTASELQSAISTLQEDNTQFRSRLSELLNKQQELAGQWQGDANTAFNNAFNSDKGQWDSFASLVDQYIQALQEILKIYETAESTNTMTAQNRTY